MRPTPGSEAPSHGGIELILGALTALAPMTIDMYLPALPTLGQDLGVEIGAVQLTLASYFAGFAVGQFAMGPLIDRYGRTRPLYAGLVAYAVASLGCAMASSLWVLVGLRFLQALGGSAATVVPRTVVRDLTRGTEAARMLSRLILVMGVAPIVAPVLGGVVLTHLGWRAIFYLLSAAAILLLFLARRALPETAPRYQPGPTLGAKLVALATEADFARYVLAGGFAFAGMFAYISGSSFVFIELFGVPADRYGYIFGANAAGFIAMSQANRAVLSRWRPEVVLKWALRATLAGATAIFALSVTTWGGVWAFAAALFVYISCLGFVGPNATALALERHGHRAGLASAVMGSAHMVIASLASAGLSALHDGSARPLGGVIWASALVAFAVAAGGRLSSAPHPESETVFEVFPEAATKT